MTKKIFPYTLLFLIMVIASACNLPLCEDGEVFCSYSVKNNTASCLEECNPDKPLGCQQYACICKEGEKDCTTFYTHKNTNITCYKNVCNNNEYVPVKENGTCKYGFDGNDCKAECRIGDNQIDEDNSGAHILSKCVADENGLDAHWEKMTCAFGIDEVRAQCNDPCELKECIGMEKECSRVLFDPATQRIFKCDAEKGWEIDNQCTNDFHVDDKMPQDLSIKQDFLSQELKDSYGESLIKLQMGVCGKCSSIQTPAFCSQDEFITDSPKYLNICDNGELKRKNDSSSDKLCESDYKTQCTDDYGTIWVDTQTNRNHCGACNHKCDATSRCENGSCVTNVECDGSGYATVQVGSRWVRAYCIESVNQLKNIGEPDANNTDHAYVLTKEIEITEQWSPINVKTGFILLGNDQKITFTKGFKSADDNVGLFNELNNSRVENLYITYKANEPFTARYFGLLAGSASHSTIKDVSIQTINPITFNTDSLLAAGGLIGWANNGVSISGIGLDMELNSEVPYNKELAGKTKGIGGLVGIAQNVDTIKNVSLISKDSIISIKGHENVGGLIGMLTDDAGNSSSNATQIIDNSNIEGSKLKIKVTGNMNVGGLIGYISGTQQVSVANISNFSIDDIKLFFKDICGNQSLIRNAGGMIGNAQSKSPIIRFSNISINKIEIKDSELSTDECGGMLYYSSRIGGMFGVIDTAELKNIKIGKILTHCPSCNSELGGIAGFVQNISLSDFEIDSIHISNNGYTGRSYYIGAIFGNLVNSEISNGSIDLSNVEITGVTSSGGLIAYASDGSINNLSINNLVLSNPDFMDNPSNLQSQLGGIVSNSNNVNYSNITINNINLNTVDCSSIGGILASSMRNLSMKNIDILNITIYAKETSNKCKIGGAIGVVGMPSNVNISDINIKAHIYNPNIYSGLIGSAALYYGDPSYGNTITVSNTIVESYIDARDYIGFTPIITGLIYAPCDTIKGLNISRSAAFTVINKRDNINHSIVLNKLLYYCTNVNSGISKILYANMAFAHVFDLSDHSDSSFSKPADSFLDKDTTENGGLVDSSNFEYCDLDKEYDETQNFCLSQSSPDLTAFVLNQHKLCSSETYYNLIKDAFCTDNPLDGISSLKNDCDYHRTTIEKSLAGVPIYYPAIKYFKAKLHCSNNQTPTCTEGEPLCYNTPISTVCNENQSDPSGCKKDPSLNPHCYKVLRPSFCK